MRYVEDFIGAVEGKKAEISRSLTAGNAVNFETYQRLVGQYMGLEDALQILNDLLKENDE
jgi:hypothetical protein